MEKNIMEKAIGAVIMFVVMFAALAAFSATSSCGKQPQDAVQTGKVYELRPVDETSTPALNEINTQSMFKD